MFLGFQLYLSYLCLCLYMASPHSLCLRLLCISQKDTSHWSKSLEDVISRISPVEILNDIDKDIPKESQVPRFQVHRDGGAV